MRSILVSLICCVALLGCRKKVAHEGNSVSRALKHEARVVPVVKVAPMCRSLRLKPRWLLPLPAGWKVGGGRLRLLRQHLFWGQTRYNKLTKPWISRWKKMLRSRKPKARRRAALMLRDSLILAMRDQRSGKAPWLATPFWGSSGRNYARNMRLSICRSLLRAQFPETLSLIRFFLDHDVLYGVRSPAMIVLSKIKGAKADGLIQSLVERPHAFAPVLLRALRAARKRKLPVARKRLLPLLHHHRSAIRKEARALYQQRGGRILAAFQPTKVMGSPIMVRLLQQMGELQPYKIPAKSPFVSVTKEFWLVYQGKKKHYQKRPYVNAWLLRETATSFEVITPFGWREVLPKVKKTQRKLSSKQGFSIIYSTTRHLIKRLSLASEIKRIEKIRKSGNKKFALSRSGGLTGQFEGRGATLYELMWGLWLSRTGRTREAARILLPAIDTLLTDEAVVRVFQRRLGKRFGFDMLRAFVGERNYPKALRMARRMTTCHPRHPLARHARRLLQELPHRANDFKQLTLPTPAKWQALRKTMPRKAQIRFLLKRLRLLNMYQMGQPGGVNFRGLQSMGPGGLSRTAAWEGSGVKGIAINPFAELLGKAVYAPWVSGKWAQVNPS